MDAIFSQTKYILKRQGLAIGGKYCLCDENGAPLLYIEEKVKWIPPSSAIHMYADEAKKREVLTMKHSDSEDVFMDVIDAESGQKIGGVGVAADDLSDLIKESWSITDADDKPIGKIVEVSVGQSMLRELSGNELPQNMGIKVGKTLAAELRQKVKMLGYELHIDFSMDTVRLLDRRLAIAAAVHAAYHQGREV